MPRKCDSSSGFRLCGADIPVREKNRTVPRNTGPGGFSSQTAISHPAKISVCSSFFARTGMSARHKHTTQAIQTSMLDHLYSYRRMLPHYQKSGSPVFITFCKLLRDPFPPKARHLVLECCIAGHGRKFQLHA